MRTLKWLIIVIILAGVDQAIKLWAEANLPLQQIADFLKLPGPFSLDLYRTYNEGVAFSFLSSFGPEMLIALTVTIIAFVLWLWRSLDPARWLSSLAYAFVISGAIGNLIDRIRIEKVIDYLLFHTQTWSFAVFNFADALISVGAAMIILDEILAWRKDRQNNATPGPQT